MCTADKALGEIDNMAQSVKAALMIGHLFHISNLSLNLTLGLTIFRTFVSPRLLITPYMWPRVRASPAPLRCGP